jgi:hypothetical protein
MSSYNQNYIERIIGIHTEESIHLDFKRGDAINLSEEKRKEIAKDVSAFANSDGGLIIYGVAEKNHKADSYAFIDGNQISKEWLEQIINTRIQRKIEGLIIYPIRFDKKIEQTIFIVEIPRSLNAPHMTSNKKFYKRYNFESVEMEEYEIRNLYSRQEKTNLKIATPRINGSPSAERGNKIINYQASIEIYVENIGQTIEKLYKTEIKIPRLLVNNVYVNLIISNNFARYEGDFSVYSIPNSSPIFQNEYATIGNITLNITKNNFHLMIENDVYIKLYFSNGLDEINFNLTQYLKYKGSQLAIDYFSD